MKTNIHFSQIGVLLTILIIGVNSSFNTYSDCGSTDGVVQSLSISGCDVKSPHECVLKRKSTVSIELDFAPKIASNSVTTVAQGIIFGAHIPFPLDNPDACKAKNVDCPVAAGTTYKYNASFPILEKYPRISLTIQWELKDDNGKDLVCIRIPAKIA